MQARGRATRATRSTRSHWSSYRHPRSLFGCTDNQCAMHVTPRTFLALAGVVVGRTLNPNSLESYRLFRSHFGVAPKTCVSVWNRIWAALPPNATPFHLLWGLLYLKTYATESNLCGMTKVKCRKTMRKWKIADLAPLLIKWSNRFCGDRGKQCKTTVDGIDFRTYQQPIYKKWWSHKFKGLGVRYEVAVCIQTGHIVWINGPYPCGWWPDMKIFRHRLIHLIPAGEKVEADKGYRGAPTKVRLPGNAVSLVDLQAKDRARGRHETVNKRFKQRGCLKQVYRHDIDKHYLQLALESGEPLYDVRY